MKLVTFSLVFLMFFLGCQKISNKLQDSIATSYENTAQSNCSIIESSLSIYYMDKEHYPDSLDIFLKENPYVQYDMAKEIIEADSPEKDHNGYYYTYKLIDKDNYSFIAEPSKPGVEGSKIFFIDKNVIKSKNIDN